MTASCLPPENKNAQAQQDNVFNRKKAREAALATEWAAKQKRGKKQRQTQHRSVWVRHVNGLSPHDGTRSRIRSSGRARPSRAEREPPGIWKAGRASFTPFSFLSFFPMMELCMFKAGTRHLGYRFGA
ncbi:hypothetical protein J3459_012546 [Metarhizium acridum]|nr:hypothetical protein J3459_012546 [Metarhizium acridum]